VRIIDIQQVLMQEPFAGFKGAELLAVETQLKAVNRQQAKVAQRRERILVLRKLPVQKQERIIAGKHGKSCVRVHPPAIAAGKTRNIDYCV